MTIHKDRIIFLDYLRIFAFISAPIAHKLNEEVFAILSKTSFPHITQQYILNIISSLFYAE